MKVKLWDKAFVLLLVLLWQGVGMSGLVPSFMLPTPIKVFEAFWQDRAVIGENLIVTLSEAFVGMAVAIVAAFLLAVMMDRFKRVYEMLYPICVVSQTIPTVAIAPILVLWFGFGVAPKIILVFLTCFFPIAVSLLGGFKSADEKIITLYKSMNASYLRILTDVKIPYATESFFSGLKISVSYAPVSALVAEWLGGRGGLGVYMTRARESFRFDKMFAVIIVVSIVSLLMMKCVKLIENKAMPWKYRKGR